MKQKFLHTLYVLALPALLSACAGPMKGDENSVVEEKEYITGSNLPQRKGTSNISAMSKDELEALRRQISNTPRN
ncbi:MAG: hypothetical protein V4488_17690 [Pseudomonadota bacterium]